MTAYDVPAEPTRKRILNLLWERPHTVGELAERLDALERHLDEPTKGDAR